MELLSNKYDIDTILFTVDTDAPTCSFASVSYILTDVCIFKSW